MSIPNRYVGVSIILATSSTRSWIAAVRVRSATIIIYKAVGRKSSNICHVFDTIYHILLQRSADYKPMDLYRIIQKDNASIVECLPAAMIAGEQDALDWVAVCGEHEAPRLLIHAGNLSEDFFDLKTGLAGATLLKFTNYRVRVALVLPPERVTQGRFGEMAREANRRNSEFHVFTGREQALEWLAGGAPLAG
jgi:uncharacterized protein DUF4180